jgi:hypothetical protein
MPKGSDIGSEGLMVISNSVLDFDIFCDFSQGDWVAIYHFDYFWVF